MHYFSCSREIDRVTQNLQTQEHASVIDKEDKTTRGQVSVLKSMQLRLAFVHRVNGSFAYAEMHDAGAV